LKLSYLANRSTGSMIPLFSTPLFVFVAIFGQTLLWLLATFGATWENWKTKKNHLLVGLPDHNFIDLLTWKKHD
jgi:hypothetical protein